MMRRVIYILLALSVGCDKETAKPSTATNSASAPSPVASVPAEKPKPWYVGTWTGKYEARHYLVETKKGEGAREWQQDAGSENEGEGKLELEVAEDGAITGSATGPLGPMTASGAVDEQSFRVRLRPSEPSETAFHGFFVAKREGKVVRGTLQASSGDSLKVRDAPIALTAKGEP